MYRTLIIHPEKCNNCGDCETACIESRTTLTAAGLSCIRILRTSTDEEFFFPIACMQCEDPPCMAVCPKEAVFIEDETDRVMIDRLRCVGCAMCVAACPFGAMRLDRLKAKAYKCDLCTNDPECVRSCEQGALEFQSIEKLKMPSMISAAGRLARLVKP